MMTFTISQGTMGSDDVPVQVEGFYSTMPDINGGPNVRHALATFYGGPDAGQSIAVEVTPGSVGIPEMGMSPDQLQATMPGIVQTANNEFAGESSVAGSWFGTGRPVHMGADGWMVGQDGCYLDGQAQLQNGGAAGIDLPDLSWCGINDWLDRNKALAVAGLALLFYGTRGAANRIRARRAR